MHLYVAMRGAKMFLDNFITELQGVYLPMEMKVDKNGRPDPNGKLTKINFQLGVRPVQIYEIAFPREHKDLILTTLLGDGPMRKEYSKFKKWLNLLRKIIGLKPIGSYDASRKLPANRSHIDTIGIGLKDDKQHPWGEGL